MPYYNVHQNLSQYLDEGRLDYALIGYFYRYNYISLESQPSFARQYALVEKGDDGRLPDVYQKVEVNLNKYWLYRRGN